MFAPGIPKIMVEFHETSATVATFVVSVYILGFAFGPLIIAPMSEVFGRARLYIYGNILFTIFTVGTALSQNMAMMMAFRFLMGLAGAVPVTIGSGSIADIMPIEQRGRAMSAWALGPLLGPCIGPVAGGYLIKAAGWRWVYWLVTIVVCIPRNFKAKQCTESDQAAGWYLHSSLLVHDEGDFRPSHSRTQGSQAPQGNWQHEPQKQAR